MYIYQHKKTGSITKSAVEIDTSEASEFALLTAEQRDALISEDAEKMAATIAGLASKS